MDCPMSAGHRGRGPGLETLGGLTSCGGISGVGRSEPDRLLPEPEHRLPG